MRLEVHNDFLFKMSNSRFVHLKNFEAWRGQGSSNFISDDVGIFFGVTDEKIQLAVKIGSENLKSSHPNLDPPKPPKWGAFLCVSFIAII